MPKLPFFAVQSLLFNPSRTTLGSVRGRLAIPWRQSRKLPIPFILSPFLRSPFSSFPSFHSLISSPLQFAFLLSPSHPKIALKIFKMWGRSSVVNIHSSDTALRYVSARAVKRSWSPNYSRHTSRIWRTSVIHRRHGATLEWQFDGRGCVDGRMGDRHGWLTMCKS